MELEADIEVVGGVTFELRPYHRHPSHKEWICLRKNRNFINRYLSLAAEFSECQMVEVGVDQGGSTSFFCQLLNPKKLLALELSDKPVRKLMEFLSEHKLEERVEVVWGVDQADPVKVPALLAQAFGKHKLDLVIDDASHILSPSTATFEMIFPNIREGGLYILEDWSSDHLVERGMQAVLDKDPDGEAAQNISAALAAADEKLETPMSVLICQLVIAAAFHPDWIAEMRVTDGFCEVRRGPGDIPPGTPIANYVGTLGQWIFEPRLN
jgi:predicted O-methyltransferase YrrM